MADWKGIRCWFDELATPWLLCLNVWIIKRLQQSLAGYSL
jgi:hypothetical protein